MRNIYDVVSRLTSPLPSGNDDSRMLNDFAHALGWKPSDQLFTPDISEIATAHLVIEHGLENTAVITFLRSPVRYSALGFDMRKRLLEISYNNLVDWHIHVQSDEVNYVYNRVEPFDAVMRYPISRDNVEKLRSDAFEQVTEKRPNPNLRALDQALIETISLWKRQLSAETNYKATNEAISSLFNAIFFVRAVEDNDKRYHGSPSSSRALLDHWLNPRSPDSTFREVVLRTLHQFTNESTPYYLVDEEMLRVFDSLGRDFVSDLISSFYHARNTPYNYDFSLMSKHALSRIYEHYVSILSVEEAAQKSFFPRLPVEVHERSYGSIYTPQFIARFFARYLRDQMPPVRFRSIHTADPACGSGIFLRTLLELQTDPLQGGMPKEQVSAAFHNVTGFDLNQNACQATRLSLSLLHLLLTDQFPQELDIHTVDAIQHVPANESLIGSYDAVIANPPFIPLAEQDPAFRDLLSKFMQGFASGRPDAYLAFLRIGLEMLKPGGYGLFVLPHSFLLGKSAAKMRQILSERAWIRCIADLSAIRVFDNTGAYVILLIFQRKPLVEEEPPLATVVKCQDMVGRALQDVIEGRRVESNTYSIYDVDQNAFSRDSWLIVPPTQYRMQERMHSLPPLEDFLQVREGFISGADPIFIVDSDEIPSDEKEIFVPFLADREMLPYVVPDQTKKSFFYPFEGGKKISEDRLRMQYPWTWKYLSSHRDKLTERRREGIIWWEPTRPRSPDNMMRPKIVTPHLVLVPRFAVDLNGKYGVSRSPLLYPRKTDFERDLLLYFVAILNSTPCYWYVSTHSHVYSNNYAMLEIKTLNRTPVPDPARIDPTVLKRLIDFAERRMYSTGLEALDIERQMDSLIADLYMLSREERRVLGIEE